jgi:hypothetical protein
MTSLIDLNLARNCIQWIGDSLKTFQNLEILNLASNLIEKLQVIIYSLIFFLTFLEIRFSNFKSKGNIKSSKFT